MLNTIHGLPSSTNKNLRLAQYYALVCADDDDTEPAIGACENWLCFETHTPEQFFMAANLFRLQKLSYRNYLAALLDLVDTAPASVGVVYRWNLWRALWKLLDSSRLDALDPSLQELLASRSWWKTTHFSYCQLEEIPSSLKCRRSIDSQVPASVDTDEYVIDEGETVESILEILRLGFHSSRCFTAMLERGPRSLLLSKIMIMDILAFKVIVHIHMFNRGSAFTESAVGLLRDYRDISKAQSPLLNAVFRAGRPL
jgi:hypothetical protein